MIYVMYLTDVKEKTKYDINTEYYLYHRNFPERNKKDFIQFKKSWGEYEFKAEFDPQGYFSSKETAFNKIRDNVLDINEGGSYPYVVLVGNPDNIIYPSSMNNEREIYVFEYVEEINEYHLVENNDDKKIQYIYERYNCGRI